MSYLFFNANKDRKYDTDGCGTEGSLGEQLDYLANDGGSPDCWDSTDTESLAKAKLEAMDSGLHLYIVNESMYRVVGEVNRPK